MNNIIKSIFSDIFDIYPTDKFINKFIIDGDIDIDLIFESDFLKLNIVYNFIWNLIYNTYPTRKDFIDFVNENNYKPENSISIDNKVYEKILNSFFHLKLGVLALFDNNELNKNVKLCDEHIKNNRFIKELIYEKLRYRYNIRIDDFEQSQNLVVSLMNIIKVKNIPTDIMDDDYRYNPISYSLNEFIVFTEDDHIYMNELEKLQYVLYKDNHFIMKMIDSIVFIVDVDNVILDKNMIHTLIGFYQKVHNKHVLIFSTDEENHNLISEWYDDMYNFCVSKDIFNILPNFCKYSLTISDFIYPEVKPLSKNNSSIYYLIGNKTNKENFLLTNKYDKYIMDNIEIIDKFSVKLEKYIILSPKDDDNINILNTHDMYADIWNIHIKHVCPVKSGDPRNGILLYLNFIYFYYLKNEKRIKNVQNGYSKKSKYCVFIVDSRPNILSIISVLFSMINLNDDWCCKFYTSTSALSYYKKYLGKFVDVVDIELLNQKFHIDIYNKLLTSVDFWDTLEGYEKCLVIQDDGVLLRKGVDRFLEYDYIGAPWIDAPGNEYLKSNVNSDLNGNGGLSLRTVSKMKDVVKNTTDEDKRILFYNNLNNSPEDIFFCKNLKKMNNVKMPSSRDASFFSSEEILNMDSLGIHKLWAYHHADSIKQYFKKVLE